MLRLGVLAGLWATLLAVTALVRRGSRPDEADVAEVAARDVAVDRTHELVAAHTVHDAGQPRRPR